MKHSKQKSAILGLMVFLSQPLFIAASAHAEASGEAVYNGTCVMCHKSGVMGAPKYGDANDWKARLAQGKETLYQHAINGFKGKKGSMPAKGGKPALSDAEVKSAVDYMLSGAM